MSGLWQFLSRTQGHQGRLTLTDWAAYAYLLFGFLIILLPVSWLALNSLKSSFQLEKQDISLLPTQYARVARGTVYGPDGTEVFFMAELPAWVLDWSSLSDDEQAAVDVDGLLAEYEGREFRLLRSHLGQVSSAARALIRDQALPAWLNRYASMSSTARATHDLDAVRAQLDGDDEALLLEYLGVAPYKANRMISQVLVTAEHPDTDESGTFAVARLTSSQDFLVGRALDDPTGAVLRLPRRSVEAEQTIAPAWRNYTDPLRGQAYGVNLDFATCVTNSVLATVIATILTLLINSMAAFALSKYRFSGQSLFLVLILTTLMVPPAITLVGVFKAINATGLSGSLWGVIIPGAATPAGVFLLRQYMLTIPDELLEAARMDAASEWKVYWRIVLPLALPALAALGILSVIWRWNDLILPMVAVATTKEAYTLQLCLLEFRGEHLSQEHYRLAMTVVSLIPTTLVFVFLQRYITTGIANSGVK